MSQGISLLARCGERAALNGAVALKSVELIARWHGALSSGRYNIMRKLQTGVQRVVIMHRLKREKTKLASALLLLARDYCELRRARAR